MILYPSIKKQFTRVNKSLVCFSLLIIFFNINKTAAQSISNTKYKGINSGIHFCIGSTDTVKFDTTGVFTGTLFRVELSDSAGVFGAPISLGTGSSTKIAITVSSLPLSNNYSLRVVRISTPAVIGDTIKFITLTKPTPSFTFTNNNSCPGTPISFTSTSAPFAGSGPLTYAWNLNAAATPPSSTSANSGGVIYPPTIGNGSTNYSVKLLVTDVYGCKDSISQNITVRHKPKANLVIDLTTTPNFSPVGLDTFTKCGATSPFILTVDDNNTLTYTNYLIKWGDTTSNYDTSVSPVGVSHSYGFIGKRNLTHVVTNSNGCKDTQNITVYIGSNPSISMPAPGNTTQLCAPHSFSFNLSGFARSSAFISVDVIVINFFS